MVNELLRQATHAGALLLLLPIMLFETASTPIVLGIVTLTFLLFAEYYTNRAHWKKRFAEVVKRLKGTNTAGLSLNTINRYENKLIEWLVNKTIRSSEKLPFFQVFLSCFSVMMAYLLFGKEIAAISVVVLATGDLFSTVFGYEFGRRALIHNKDKTWLGTLAFIVSAAVFVYAFLLFFPAYIVMPLGKLLFICCVLGSVIESLPVNDNLTIPLGVGLLLYVL